MLRCPFGCRQHHRRQQSHQRSTGYYQTRSGQAKKKRLNARRSMQPQASASHPQPDRPPECDVDRTSSQPANQSSVPVTVCLEGVVLSESTLANSITLSHLRMIVRLIEGVVLNRREMIDLLRAAMRQHSFAYRRRIDYVLAFLHQHPP